MSRGINTLDDLKGRCVVDEDTGCWHYRGAFTRSTKVPSVTATIWYPALQRSISVAKAIGLMTDKVPPEGRIWFRACKTWDCVCPDHYRIGTPSQRSKIHRTSNTPLHNAQISAAQRRLRGLPVVSSAVGSSIFNYTSTL